MNANLGAIARAWWFGLQPAPIGNGPGDRGALARLRRAATPEDAMMEQATVRLLRQVNGTERDFERIALVAALLAHVRQDGTLLVAQQMAAGERPLVSPLRFKRLLAVRDTGDALSQFRRLIALLGTRGINVADLAWSIFDWTDERRGDKRRRDWIYAYHNAFSDEE